MGIQTSVGLKVHPTTSQIVLKLVKEKKTKFTIWDRRSLSQVFCLGEWPSDGETIDLIGNRRSRYPLANQVLAGMLQEKAGRVL